MTGKYILEGKKAVPADLMTWAAWFEKADRRVAFTTIGFSSVSTVFLGLDHQWGDGPPLLFETLVTGGPMSDDMERYSTWQEAEAGHREIVERVTAAERAKDEVT